MAHKDSALHRILLHECPRWCRCPGLSCYQRPATL